MSQNLFNDRIFNNKGFNQGLFTPVTGGLVLPDIDGLVFRGNVKDDNSHTATGTDLDSLIDLSGNGNDAVSEAVNPIVGTRTINGINAIDNQGTNNQGLRISYDTDFDIDQGATVFVVCEPDNVSQFAPVIGQVQASGGRIFNLNNNSAANGAAVTYYPSNTGGLTINRPLPLTNNTPTILAFRYDPSAQTAAVLNGRTVPRSQNNGVTINKPATPNDIVIGNLGTGTFPWNGAIGEVLWYARALSPFEIDKVGDFLSLSWLIPWIKSTQTMNIANGGQSNEANAFFVGSRGYATFNQEGKTALETTLSGYFDDVEYTNQTDTGEPVMQVNGTGADHWIDTDLTDGAIFVEWENQIANYVDGQGSYGQPDSIRAIIWVGGEGDAGTNEADFEAALSQLYTRFKEETQSGVRIFATIIGTLTTNDPQGVRNAIIDIIDSVEGVYFGAEAYDLDYAGDDIHLLPASQTILQSRIAERVAAVFGKRSEAGTLGAIATGGTYSGNTVVINFDKDDDSDLSGTEIGQFRIEDDGAAATINSFVIDNSAATITFTLNGAIASGSTVKFWNNYGEMTGLTKANIVKDANGLPMRTVKELTLTEI